MNNKRIIVCCYDFIEQWESRDNALSFYRNATKECEGCERERYLHIYFDLQDGKDICTDGISDYDVAKLNKRYLTFANPNNTRDYQGKIYSPKF